MRPWRTLSRHHTVRWPSRYSSYSTGSRARTSINRVWVRRTGVVASLITGQVLLTTLTSHELHADSGEDTRSWISKPLSFISRTASVDDDRPRQSLAHDHAGITDEASSGGAESKGAFDILNGFPGEESASKFFNDLRDRIATFDFALIGDKISDAILPSWVRTLPGFLRKLQAELDMSPGSLAEEIWNEAFDVEINPEIMWDAQVRLSMDLCREERAFIEKRSVFTRAALARYLGVREEDVHLDDVPVIAMCGSGGGLRALVAGTSSYLTAQQSGLFDCVTYTAGVSGSCWLQTLFYSSIGKQDHAHIIEHLKHRLGIHIAFPPAALALLISAPTNKYLLSGLVEKLRGLPKADFGLVDVYGLLLASRIMVPKGDLGIDSYDLKVSNQARYLEDGRHPLPIYTAVRHEIPLAVAKAKTPAESRAQAKKEAWFQWFEWTPYEFFCEELEAGIPTWAVGRNFDRGRNQLRDNGLVLPELRLPVLMGIWGSAFCATLSHYYKEVRPIVKGLAGLGGIDQMISGRDEELIKVHPIDPATIPNFALNMRDMLPQSCPEGIHTASHLQLMDAGMSNNLPIYPLLRPGREVDIIVAFDASADVKQDNWLKVTDGYVKQRGIRGWPAGAGWPENVQPEQETVESSKVAKNISRADVGSGQAQRQDGARSSTDLGYCTVWVGSTVERHSDGEPPPSKAIEEDWEVSSASAGIAVVYFPLVANPAVPGVDPQTSDFLSTWNFIYTPKQVDQVVALAKANFEAGSDKTKRTVRAVWERKRAHRLEREQRMRESRWSLELINAHKQRQFGEQGDHFS